MFITLMRNKIVLFILPILLLTSCFPEHTYSPQESQGEHVITSFKFEKALNPQLEEDIELSIRKSKNKLILCGYLRQELEDKTLIPTFTTKVGTLNYQGTPIESGAVQSDFSTTVNYYFLDWNSNYTECSVNLVEYTGLPVVTINTKDGNSVDRNRKKRAYIKIDEAHTSYMYEDSISISGHGETDANWSFAKKEMELFLTDKADLLGMPAHTSWVLLANYRDRTLLRNDVTHHIGSIVSNDAWIPRSRYVEVILNGSHIGNYQLCETIVVDENRLNITPMSASSTSEPDISGGYLFKLDTHIDKFPIKFRTTQYNLPFIVLSPHQDDFDIRQKTYIEDHINTLESLLYARNHQSVHQLLDISSFANYWIVNALIGTTEPSWPRNVFLYKDKSNKLSAGPLWIYDYTSFATASTQFNNRTTTHTGSWWYKELFNDPLFKEELKKQFQEIKGQLESVPQYIQQRAAYLKKSEKINHNLWPTSSIKLTNGDESIVDYEEAVDRMISIYLSRLDLIESLIHNSN